MPETATPILINNPAAEIELHDGEHYAGVVLGADGQVQHHLVLMAPRPDARLPWPAAMEWAKGAGGSLPTRQEAALLFANCKPHLDPRWHWTSEADGPSLAWHCYFSHGYQDSLHQGREGGAVAVRRFTPSVL
jgi:hypothetical protein